MCISISSTTVSPSHYFYGNFLCRYVENYQSNIYYRIIPQNIYYRIIPQNIYYRILSYIIGFSHLIALFTLG